MSISRKRWLHAVLALCVAAPLLAQQLPLPPRPPTALGGRAFATSIASLSRAEREEQIFAQFMAGNVPGFLRGFAPVSITSMISGTLRTATCYVLPEYLALGSDDDYFLMPMTPLLAQRIVDATGCVLPTKKLVDAIYQAATVKLAPQPIPPSAAMITVPVFAQHNDSVWQQRSPLITRWPLGQLVGGHKKDVIVSNRIYSNLKPTVPRPVVIYGWHQTNGIPIQPVYNGHEETYADYSHGVRLVHDTMVIDGSPATVRRILSDSTLNVLLSDEGVITRSGYGITTGVQEGRHGGSDEQYGSASGLQANYPNPFNTSTVVSYQLLAASNVQLAVYNLLGQEVARLVDENQPAGAHTVQFEARGLASGVYLVRFQTPSQTEVRTLCLLQ
jgi:hypothetical protein